MKIKTEELRKFLSAAGNISPNPLHINLDSIMIECVGNEVVFTKTNNNIWCKYSYVCQPASLEKFYISERMLNGIAATSNEYEFSIDESIDGAHIVLTDGDGVIKSKKQDFSQFPVMQQAIGEKVKIDQNTAQHLRTAGKFISMLPLKTNASYVNVSGDGIFAFNLMVAYYYKAVDLPVIMLDHEPLNVIRTNDDVWYWTSGSFDFFQFDGFTQRHNSIVLLRKALSVQINGKCIQHLYANRRKFPIHYHVGWCEGKEKLFNRLIVN